jgi:hypothetical protein
VPVDTYLRRKNLSRYQTVELGDVRVHVATALTQWAESAVVDAERFLFFWKRFDVQVAHRHQPT